MARNLSLGIAVLALGLISAPALGEPDVAEFSKADAAALLDGDPDPGAASAAGEAGEGHSATPPTRAWTLGAARPQPGAGPYRAPGVRRAGGRVAGSVTGVEPPPAVTRTLLPLQFAVASSALSPQSRANLQNLADVMLESKHLQKRVRIIGHADKSGSPEFNQILSQQRAQAAVDYLARIGINHSRLEAVGVSSHDPLPNMSVYDPRNRRVEIERTR